MHIGLLALQHTNTALCTTRVTPHSTRYVPHVAGLPCNTATNAVTQYTLSATRLQDSLQHTTYTVSGHCMCVTQYTLHATRTQDSLQHSTNTTCVSYSTHYTPQGHRTPCNTLPTLHVVYITHYTPRNNPDLKQEKTHTHTHTHTHKIPTKHCCVNTTCLNTHTHTHAH